MNPRRNSIARLMWIVGIVALNLAVGRSIFLSEPWRLAGIGPIAVAIELGLVCLIRARGRPRRYAFWTGFEAGSLLGLWSFVCVRVPESRVGALWDEYGAFIDGQLLAAYGLSVLDRGPLDPVFLSMIAVFAFLPQLLLGIAGGFLGLSLAWSRRSRVLTFTLFAIAAFLVLHVAAWLAAWNALSRSTAVVSLRRHTRRLIAGMGIAQRDAELGPSSVSCVLVGIRGGRIVRIRVVPAR